LSADCHSNMDLDSRTLRAGAATDTEEEGLASELSELFIGVLKIEDLESSTEWKKEALLRKLISNPHHFSAWCDGIIEPPFQKWTLEDKKNFLEEFYNAFSDLRMLPEQDFQTFIQRFDINMKEMFGVPTATLFFTEAFIHTVTGLKGWQDNAIRCIRNSQLYTKLFMEDAMDSEYIPGVVYLNRWTLLAMLLKQGKLPPNANPEEYDGEKEFELLPNKSKALVLWAKIQILAKFQWYIPKGREISFDALRQVLEDTLL
jgi:hypothetical protein